MALLTPDEIVSYRPTHCDVCQFDLHQAAGNVKERRQMHDIPEIRLQVVEHQIEEICCPACQHLTRANFPVGVDAPAQYGPHVQSLAVYLSQFQLLPMARTCEVLEDLCQCHLSEATLVHWIREAAKQLEPTIQHLTSLLIASPFEHADETEIRIKGLLHWVHVNSTRWLTLYSWHRKRRHEALETIGIWPHFHGRAMHDRWASYDRYACAHSLCGAPLLRDCLFVAEQEKQSWAQEMFELLLVMTKAADHWRTQEADVIPKAEQDGLIAQYFAILVDAHLQVDAPHQQLVILYQGEGTSDAGKLLCPIPS